MAAIDDFNAELAKFTTSISNEIAASTAAITAAVNANDTAAVTAATQKLVDLQATVDAYTASLAPTTPPPAAV